VSFYIIWCDNDDLHCTRSLRCYVRKNFPWFQQQVSNLENGSRKVGRDGGGSLDGGYSGDLLTSLIDFGLKSNSAWCLSVSLQATNYDNTRAWLKKDWIFERSLGGGQRPLVPLLLLGPPFSQCFFSSPPLCKPGWPASPCTWQWPQTYQYIHSMTVFSKNFCYGSTYPARILPTQFERSWFSY
jgi:hypothetical protein